MGLERHRRRATMLIPWQGVHWPGGSGQQDLLEAEESRAGGAADDSASTPTSFSRLVFSILSDSFFSARENKIETFHCLVYIEFTIDISASFHCRPC